VVQEAESEPTVRRDAFPVIWLAILSLALYFGSMYIVDFGGQADARVHYPYSSFKQIEDMAPKGEEDIIKAKGALVYSRICAGCHQNDGNGSASLNAPPLAGSEWVNPNDPSRIIRIVLHGLSGPISVKGQLWGAGVMLAWKDGLNDEEIAHVLSYVRNSWGNKAPIVKAELVKKIRDETKGWPGYMNVGELEKVVLQP